MKKRSQLIFWNILIFTILLLIVNMISWLILQYKDYQYKTFTANIPAMTNENYWELQEEWYTLQTEYQPFVAWKRKPFSGKYMNIEAGGIRKTINSKDGKVVRFFGGSTMWGARVLDQNTIPSWFGACSSADYKIINHGESGFNARQELAELINVFLKKEATDLVVFYDGVNDIDFLCNPSMSIPGHRRELQFREKLMTQNSTQNYFKANDTMWALGKGFFYKLFLNNTVQVLNRTIGKYVTQDSQIPYACHIDAERAEKVADNLLNCWKTAHDISNQNGSEFIAILQPNIYVDEANHEYLHQERSGLQGQNFQTVYGILQQKIQTEKLDWIYDFSNVLDGTTNPLYFDFCHLNGEGNQIVAEKMCEVINELSTNVSVDSLGDIGN